MIKDDKQFCSCSVGELKKEMRQGFKKSDCKFGGIDEHFKEVDKHFKEIDRRFEQVDKRFEQVDKRFEQVDKRFEQVDKRFEQIDKRFEQVDQRFERLEVQVVKNSEGIRYNGVRIEKMQRDIDLLVEVQGAMSVKMTEVDAKLDTLLDIMGTEYPVLKTTVSNHSRRIAKLEAKCL